MNDQANQTKDYLSQFWSDIVNALPAIIGALIILLITYIVAKVLQRVAYKSLNKLEFNERIHSMHGGPYIQRALPSPSNFVGRVVYWLVFLFGLSLAVSALGVPILNDFLRGVYSYIPNIIAAILIFMIASGISAAIVTLSNRMMGDTPTGKLVAAGAPVVIMSIAVFMILNQLRIAPEIVTITYAAILGSAALGMALAFGLGGRDVASTILSDLYAKGQVTKAQAKADLKRGAANTRREVRRRTP